MQGSGDAKQKHGGRVKTAQERGGIATHANWKEASATEKIRHAYIEYFKKSPYLKFASTILCFLKIPSERIFHKSNKL